MRRDLGDDGANARHDGGKVRIEPARQAESLGPASLVRELGGADERLGRHAAAVEAVAAHCALFDQQHPRARRRRDHCGDQSGRSGADDDQIVVEAARPRPRRERGARFAPGAETLGGEGRRRQGDERDDDARAQDVLGRGDRSELLTGGDIKDDDRQRADQRDQHERAHAHARQADPEINGEERNERGQSRREEIARAVARDAAIDAGDEVGKARLDRVAKDSAGQQHGDRRAQRAGKGDERDADPWPEQRATRDAHRPGARQRQRREGDVERGVGERRNGEMLTRPAFRRDERSRDAVRVGRADQSEANDQGGDERGNEPARAPIVPARKCQGHAVRRPRSAQTLVPVRSAFRAGWRNCFTGEVKIPARGARRARKTRSRPAVGRRALARDARFA